MDSPITGIQPEIIRALKQGQSIDTVLWNIFRNAKSYKLVTKKYKTPFDYPQETFVLSDLYKLCHAIQIHEQYVYGKFSLIGPITGTTLFDVRDKELYYTNYWIKRKHKSGMTTIQSWNGNIYPATVQEGKIIQYINEIEKDLILKGTDKRQCRWAVDKLLSQSFN
jgi:hypothetical protein